MEIVHIIPGRIWGGAEQYILDLSHALAERGHTVRLVACDTPAVTGRLKDEPFETCFLPMKWPFDRRSTREIARVIASADVVHVHDIKHVRHVVKARKAACSQARIVLTRHIARPSRTMPWLRRAMRSLHRMIFVSDLGMSLWSSANRWMPAERLTRIHNSIPPLGAAQTQTLRDIHGIGADTPLLVFTGRIRRSKGAETIVRALSRIRDLDFKMVFVGACKPLDYIEKTLKPLARELGVEDRLVFHGFSSDVRHLISGADIGLAPSIVREACPLSPMEYMQQGICVVSTDNGGQAEYITDGREGFLIATDDDEALADHIRRLIADPGLRRMMGENAREKFESTLNYRTFANNILNQYL